MVYISFNYKKDMKPLPSKLALWINAWLELVDAILCILSFTLIRTSFSYRFIVWDCIQVAKSKQNR